MTPSKIIGFYENNKFVWEESIVISDRFAPTVVEEIRNKFDSLNFPLKSKRPKPIRLKRKTEITYKIVDIRLYPEVLTEKFYKENPIQEKIGDIIHVTHRAGFSIDENHIYPVNYYFQRMLSYSNIRHNLPTKTNKPSVVPSHTLLLKVFNPPPYTTVPPVSPCPATETATP